MDGPLSIASPTVYVTKYVKETNDPVWLKGINILFQQTAIDEICGQTAGIMGPSSTDPVPSSPKSFSPSPVRGPTCA